MALASAMLLATATRHSALLCKPSKPSSAATANARPAHREPRVVSQAQELQMREAAQHGGGEGAGEAVALPVDLRGPRGESREGRQE